MKKKILVVFNTTVPRPPDFDYTEKLKEKDWETEKDVISALKSLGHDYALLGVYDDIDLISDKIKEYKPDGVFNLVERFKGDTSYDRDVASYLDLQGVPFTGCGPTGLTLSKNKGLSKKILSFHRIRVPRFEVFQKNKKIAPPKKLRYPLFIKPLKEEASFGIAQASHVETEEQFMQRVQFIHENMGQDAIVEEYIEGRELYVSIMGNGRLQVFPVRELKFTQVPDEEPKFASYRAKWDTNYRKKWGIRNQFPGTLPHGVVEKIEKMCKKIYRLLSLNGYARLDLRLTAEGEVVFIEANPNPILSRWEDFAESGVKSGLTYPKLIEKILGLAKAGPV